MDIWETSSILSDTRKSIGLAYRLWNIQRPEGEDIDIKLYRNLRRHFSFFITTDYILRKYDTRARQTEWKIHSKLKSNVVDAVTIIGLSGAQIRKLLLTKRKIVSWLKRNKIMAKLELDTFTDSDDSDWLEIKLIIRLKNFKSEYQRVKEKTYDIFDSSFDEKLYNKIMLKIEPWN